MGGLPSPELAASLRAEMLRYRHVGHHRRGRKVRIRLVYAHVCVPSPPLIYAVYLLRCAAGILLGYLGNFVSFVTGVFAPSFCCVGYALPRAVEQYICL